MFGLWHGSNGLMSLFKGEMVWVVVGCMLVACWLSGDCVTVSAGPSTTKQGSDEYSHYKPCCYLPGLRGAVAFALALQDTSTEARRTILSTTLLLVCISVLGLGAATSPMLRWLNIRSVNVSACGPDDTESLPRRDSWSSLILTYLQHRLLRAGTCSRII